MVLMLMKVEVTAMIVEIRTQIMVCRGDGDDSCNRTRLNVRIQTLQLTLLSA